MESNSIEKSEKRINHQKIKYHLQIKIKLIEQNYELIKKIINVKDCISDLNFGLYDKNCFETNWKSIDLVSDKENVKNLNNTCIPNNCLEKILLEKILKENIKFRRKNNNLNSEELSYCCESYDLEYNPPSSKIMFDLTGSIDLVVPYIEENSVAHCDNDQIKVQGNTTTDISINSNFLSNGRLSKECFDNCVQKNDKNINNLQISSNGPNSFKNSSGSIPQHKIKIPEYSDKQKIDHKNEFSYSNGESPLSDKNQKIDSAIPSPIVERFYEKNSGSNTSKVVVDNKPSKAYIESLWQSKECPSNMPYRKENKHKLALYDEKNGRTIIGASMRGRSHAHSGTARDDDFGVKCTSNCDWIIVVVADGAGSAMYSRRGSQIVSESVTEYCDKLLSDPNNKINQLIDNITENYTNEYLIKIKKAGYEILVNAAHDAQKKILYEASNAVPVDSSDTAKITSKDYATTCLIAITKKCLIGDLVISFSIGDGAIACYAPSDTGNVKYLMSMPDSGEFAGQTHFITMNTILKNYQEIINNRMRLCVFKEKYKALMLMTDGVSDPYFETEDLLTDNRQWDVFWNRLTSQDDNHLELDKDKDCNSSLLLEWLNFYESGHHDDRTIVVVY